MVEGARNFLRDNSTLIYFLIAQFVAIGAGAASVLAYMVKLESRVYTMEHRGAEFTVSQMAVQSQRITVLEQKADRNEASINRIVDTMTKKLNVNP